MVDNESHGIAASSRSSVFLIGTVLVLLYVISYLAVTSGRPLFTPDEARYAQIPGEMIQNGDWTVLKQSGLRYYEKPPLGYWLNALSISVFGHNNFAVRFPSALSGGVAALAIFLLVARVRRDRLRGVLAALVYLSCVHVFGISTFAVLDGMFTMFVCLSLVFYAAAEFGPENRRRAVWIALAGAACGAAFLTKGFTAFVMPAVSLTAWLCWQKRFRELLYFWVVPVGVAALITLPAALAVHKANPDFWHHFFWVEHVGRFLDPHWGQHDQPVWFFLPVFLAAALPWTFLLPSIVNEARKSARGDAFTRYCVCWFILPFLFFSACGGKLPTYILPCLPTFAILAADGLLAEANNRRLRIGAICGAVVFVAALAGILIWLPFGDEVHMRETLFGSWKTIPLSASILLTAACLYFGAARRFADSATRVAGICWTGLSLFFMAVACFLFMPDGFGERKSPQRLIEEAMPLSPENAFIVTDRVSLSTVCWQWRRTDGILFFSAPGELYYGLQFPDVGDRYVYSPAEAAARTTAELDKGRPVVTLLSDDNHRHLREALGDLKPAAERSRSIFFWTLFTPESGKTAERH